MKPLLACLLALVLVACGNDTTLVVINRLAPGGGEAGNGGAAAYEGSSLDILVRLEADATDFNPADLMRLLVNGVDRTGELRIGGQYALLRLEPPPVGAPQFVELFRRTATRTLDTFTYNPLGFSGPTLAAATPNTAREGVAVELQGAGFLAGPVRVFFGGVEAAVDSVSATVIDTTVPAGARPGLVYVLVGADAAEGLVGFQPLDANDQPVPFSTSDDPVVWACFPGKGTIETAVQVFGRNFDDDTRPTFNNRDSSVLFGFGVVNVDPIGDIESAFGVVNVRTEPGAGTLQVGRFGRESNILPFTVTP